MAYSDLKTKLSYQTIKAAVLSKGYAFFEGEQPYDMNIIGIRANNIDQTEDAYDDAICALYIDESGYKRAFIMQGTTDPGIQHLQKPIFKAAIENGTAILVPGQYRGCYTMGAHGRGNWRHEALQQTGAVKIYRDGNLNNELDFEADTITKGWFGINIHAASLWRDLKKIGRYSAGCQVVSDYDDFKLFIAVCKMQAAYWPRVGNVYTYTLLEEKDIDRVFSKNPV